MNTEEKTAWIDEKNKIVSFHAIDDGKMIIKAESLFWDFFVRTDKLRIPDHVKGE